MYFVKKFESEAEMEDKLIDQLINGESQWDYRPDLRNEEDLWDNFRKILTRNNKDKLNDVPLTDTEFDQVKTQLNFGSFYRAAEWLKGENGIAQVLVQREDSKLGKVSLTVFKSQDISGGISVYEVINQYASSKRDEQDRNRRFDVTLLINGLPLIQIELKNRSEGYMAAFEQIKKYSNEGKYTGIFSMLQMFVVTNGVDTKYIAAADGQHINKEFLTSWVDKNNNRVNNYLGFAKEVLSIPQGHKMITEFSVLDADHKAIILLRPYQIHAILAVEQAVRQRQSGYVWHTTGSGKTLTSYKVARNLLRSPALDKTIFIVDRIDLDQQTGTAFKSYAMNDVVEVNDTDNVSDLVRKLTANDRDLVITTIQKLNYVMKRYGDKEDNRIAKKLRNLNIGFVVDECHRAVTPKKQQEITKFFPKSLWYGFTGTPIFAENARDEFGDMPRTTEEQYGPRLHEYTVKEAIHDKAVLGFQVEYINTLEKNSIVDYFDQSGIDIDGLSEHEIEAKLPREAYENDEHKLKVIDQIVNYSRHKFKLTRGPGNTYSAILTTRSIPDAQRYYELFNEVKEGKSSVKISEKTKSLVSDFPKVAVTYSLNETEETSFERQSQYKQIIQDYNEMFNTHYDLEQVRAFNQDINNRLARKKDKYRTRSEQLDIVIVVDRLLTGFDSPSTAILFMDRPPAKPHHLIQAFSRTNRIYDKDKQYGQIMTFQYPSQYQEAVENAFILYSNGGESAIQAPGWNESYGRFQDAYERLISVAPSPESIDVNDDVDTLKLFVKAYQEFDKSLGAIQVYSEFDEDVFEQQYGLRPEVIESYHGKYENALEKIREQIDEDEEDDLTIDFDYQLSEVGKQQIDYEYLMLLMQTIVNEPDSQNRIKRIVDAEAYLTKFKDNNPKLGEIIEDIFSTIKDGNELTPAEDTLNVANEIEKRIDERVSELVHGLTESLYVQEDDLHYLIENYKPDKSGKQAGEKNLIDNMEVDRYLEENRDKVKKRFRVPGFVKREYTDVIESEILPLTKKNF